MLGPEAGDFLWSDPANSDQPRDIGYAIGARIVETFYAAAKDKIVATRVVLGVVDYIGFLNESGYRPTAHGSPQ